MDEEISIINSKTRNEKIKDFFIEKRKLLFSIVVIFILILVSFYSFQIYKNKEIKIISTKYNNAIIKYNNGDKFQVTNEMKEIVNRKNPTYSPLAIYFLIDNNLIENNNEINELFDIIINKTSLDLEIKNLIIFKKGLYNADFASESELLNILNPIINSNSVWKSHALYLLAEYFFSKKEKQKSKEFYNQILNVENANQDIIKEAKKRLNRDLSD